MAGFKEYQMLFQLNASVGSGFNSTFSSGAAQISKLQEQINSLNKTQGDISSYEKQQKAIDKTKAKIELYQTQLQNLQNATATSSKEEAELANAIAAKEKQLTDATAKLDEQNAALSETGQRLREAGVDTNDLANESARLAKESEEVKQAQVEEAESSQDLTDALQGVASALEAIGAMKALEALFGALKECSQSAAEFETAMAGVKRTVGGDDDFISALGESFKQMSTEMPITAKELANIATTAGQLGIAQENVETFTTVMAQLATTTDLTADNAATMLAQFANITGVTDYERLGATVAALGDSTATTASKVVEMSQGMAAAANVAGMSERDILAIAAAVGSLGIEAASGSTSMSTLISSLYKATQTGDKLEEFANVANMSAQEFASAWAGDPVRALDAFIQGLNDTERNGESAIVILDELGIKNVRQTKAILGLASAGDLLSNTIAQANTAWEENSALAEKAGIMYGTTEAKMTMMQNAANNVQVAIGDALNPVLGGAAEALTGLLQPIAEFIEANPALVQGVTAFVGVLGIATVAITAVTAATKLWATANTVLGASLPGIGVIVGIAAAVGGLVTAISAISSANNEASKSFEDFQQEYTGVKKSMEQDQELLDLLNKYQRLSKEIKAIKDYDGTEVNVDADIDVEGTEDVPALKEASEIESSSADITINVSDPGYDEVTEDIANIDQLLTDDQKKLLVKINQEGYDDVNSKLTALSSQIQSTSKELNTEKKKLESMAKKAKKLQEEIDKTKDKKIKGTLTEELEELDGQLAEQRSKVSKLEADYGQLAGEYEATAEVAGVLNSKELELEATKKALIVLSGGQITATENEAEAFDEQAKALKTATEAQEALNKAKLAQLQLDAMDSLGQKAVVYAQSAEAYKQATDTIQSASKNVNDMTDTAALKEKLRGIVDEVGRLMAVGDESGEIFDWDDSKIKALREEFTMLAKAATGLDLDPENFYAMGNAYSLVSNSAETATRATANLGDEIETAEANAAAAESAMNTYVDSVVQLIEAGFDAGVAEQYMRTALEAAGYEASVADEIMDKVNQTLGEHKQAAEDAAKAAEELEEANEGLGEGSEQAASGVDSIIAKIDQLASEYQAAYDAAKKSIEGQFKLFEKAGEINKPKKQGDADKNVTGYKDALQSQQAFIDEYKKNFQAAAEAGVDADLLSQLADGSTESAEQLANLAQASKEEIEALNSQYEALQQSKEDFANTIAEIETNFSGTMDTLQQELSDAVASMDFSTEAGQNAKTSIKAFIDMAATMLPQVTAAYKRLANAAKLALKFNPTGGGYATGTENAKRGVHLVGEEGPELVYFHGGEKVLNARETLQAIRANASNPDPVNAQPVSNVTSTAGNTYQIDFNPQYNIAPGVNASEIQSVLNDHTQNLRAQIESVIKDLQRDQQRRAYA